LTASELKAILKNAYAFRGHSLFIPEYTWKDLRIDALIVDINRRWIRGFEIKVNRGDFLKDDKWTLINSGRLLIGGKINLINRPGRLLGLTVIF
jgi:hypothetical protein